MNPFRPGEAATGPRRVLRAFLCHSSGDKSLVRQYSARLKSDGFAPWLDEEKILPGEEWDRAIRRAVREAHVVIVFLSTSSITKEGYVQKEIRLALDTADEKPEGTIFVIPARLEPCEVPERLRGWQRVDLFDSHGYFRLAESLRRREEQVEQSTDEALSHAAASPDEGSAEAPDDSSTPPHAAGRERRSWSRADRIALLALVAGLVSLPGIYLAVPGVAEYIRNRVAGPSVSDPASAVRTDGDKALAQTDDHKTSESSTTRPPQIFVQTSVFPLRLYLDGAEVATLTGAAPSTTLDTSLGRHQVTARSQSFERNAFVTLSPSSPAQVLFIDKKRNRLNK